MDIIGKHYWVTGRVQGVFFRANTQKIEKELGLTGWVRNCADGRVEVLAFGSKKAHMKLHDWLRTGPKLARVDEVAAEEPPP